MGEERLSAGLYIQYGALAMVSNCPLVLRNTVAIGALGSLGFGKLEDNLLSFDYFRHYCVAHPSQ